MIRYLRGFLLVLCAQCTGTPALNPHDAADGDVAMTSDAGADGHADVADAQPSEADLLAAKLATCANELTNGQYSAKQGLPANIAICGLVNALFFKADMDVDCDGQTTTQCNINTDPAYQPDTSAHDSQSQPLDAAQLPYVVIPLPSSRFDYTQNNIKLGQVVLVMYQGQIQYGIFGDEGPPSIIGEASYAMASALGIDPDPSTGGVDTGVTYVVFTGPSGVVTANEDHVQAVTIGRQRLAQLFQEN